VRPEKAEKLIRDSRWYMLAGGVLLVVGILSHGTGITAGVMALTLGASGGAFERWREERGLWMLSALFLLMFGSLGIVMEYELFMDGWRGKSNGILVTIEFSIAMWLLQRLVRFLAAVTGANYRLGRDDQPSMRQ